MSACPQCDTFNSRVNETRRLRNGWVRRHRRCLEEECSHRWYTYELPKDELADDPNRHPDALKEAVLGGDEC